MTAAMLVADVETLDGLLDEQYVLTHMTGHSQSKRDWLAAIESGQMRYHSASERKVEIVLEGNTARVVGRSVVDATIYGSRGTWNLQLETRYRQREGAWVAVDTVASAF